MTAPSIDLDGPGAAEYFALREGCAPQDLSVKALGGGVSNHVLLVEAPSRRYIVKQALGKLRVKEDWFSSPGRIWREASALRFLAPVLPPDAVPQVLFEDRENFLFAMTVAPGETTWKELLMEGAATEIHARKIGGMHAALLAASLRNDAIASAFPGLEVFDQLRLDPYYRFTAARHPDLSSFFHAAIERCQTARISLVHGDWSPKNLIVAGNHVTAIDFEVIHYGDPAFDAAFLLNHLMLKSFYRPQYAGLYRRLAEAYWRDFQPDPDVERGAIQHLPLLMLARMDGKSPAEYIQDADLKERIRSAARAILWNPPPGILSVFAQDSLYR